jgi:hypothetical protein
LAIDLPSNQQPMEIIFLTTMSPGGLCIFFSLCSTCLLSHDKCWIDQTMTVGVYTSFNIVYHCSYAHSCSVVLN